MVVTGPQAAIANTFVELSDTLVADFDLVEFLHLVTVRTQQTLGIEAVGLLLADKHGGLNVVAASSEQARVLELFQLQNAEGRCLDCYRTGQPVSCPDLSTESNRWPRFVPKALDSGFAAVHALPMRLRHKTIDGMNLFTATSVL
jgi:GAF domain-containing protein